MKRIYSIQTNIHSNACESDDINDINKWIYDNLPSFPLGTIINIRVREVPEDIFNAYPPFEGFQDVNTDAPEGSD